MALEDDLGLRPGNSPTWQRITRPWPSEKTVNGKTGLDAEGLRGVQGVLLTDQQRIVDPGLSAYA